MEKRMKKSIFVFINLLILLAIIGIAVLASWLLEVFLDLKTLSMCMIVQVI